MNAAARRVAGALLSLAALTPWAAPADRPEAGRHAAEFCVATGAAAPSCGPARVDLGRDGSVRVRLDDIEYRMRLRSSQAEVVLTHGAVQIDEFTVPYEWVGRALQFADERNARYEIRFPASPPARR